MTRRQLELVRRMWESTGAEVVDMGVVEPARPYAGGDQPPAPCAGLCPGGCAGPERGQRGHLPLRRGRLPGFYPHRVQRPGHVARHCLANRRNCCARHRHVSASTWRRACGRRWSADADALHATFTAAKAARDAFAVLPAAPSEEIRGIARRWNSKLSCPGGILSTCSISGEARVPGDKSISHRSIMLGSLAEGVTRVSRVSRGRMRWPPLPPSAPWGWTSSDPVRAGGASGRGPARAFCAPGPLDLGNSGTGDAVDGRPVGGQAFATELTGDASLCRSPHGPGYRPAAEMGAEISGERRPAAPAIHAAAASPGFTTTCPWPAPR